MLDTINTTFEIRLNGLVQGVGFRPFVFQLANEWGLKGKVSNGAAGVVIRINADLTTASRFREALLHEAPALAQIIQHTLQEIEPLHFESFDIVESETAERFSLVLPPDFALCNNCRQELHDPANRRYRYPFITCTHCGPRYSIITALPYDRPYTSMAAFKQCASCWHEYNDPADRRFYAQTNSCDDCGPQLGWYKTDGTRSVQLSFLNDSRWILPRVNWALKAGKILAVKGIGGYLLLCDATNEQAVETLRRRKHRPQKPFAVLYPMLEMLQAEVALNEVEINALQGVAAPIVPAERQDACRVAQNVAPQLSSLGIMLPYTPLLDLIANDFGKPLVATSGNISGNPIVYEDEKALTDLTAVADHILTNNRPIAVPQDDSVLRFTPKHQQPIVIRRSRGLPLYVPKGYQNSDFCVAMGASMKSTFAINTTDYLYVSQYLGDLESYETQQNFEQVSAHFLRLQNPDFLPVFGEIKALFCDAHEGYFSTQLAVEAGHRWQIPIQKIQHHQAHLAAVLAENDLLHSTQPLLGVVWDGTGYGSDGQIWGGEFYPFNFSEQPLSKQLRELPHRLHFDYFDALLGDKMPREPRLSALSFCKGVVGSDAILQPKFSPVEWGVYQNVLSNNLLKTSSVGRIFDAVASVLGLMDKVTYEGEAAFLLETLAARYFARHGYAFSEYYLENTEIKANIPTRKLAEELLIDIQKGCSSDWIAAKFHFSLVKIVETTAQRLGVRQLAFSGGVFQNAVLIDLLIEHLSPHFQLYFHRQLSPNDENIAYGQMVLGSLLMKD
ncbi:carbamoyltransferase HypF [Runella slithyformis]|uniref:Carbamoyltransferase n=1 Tax=Runella slithyformis (strain ATCC 29530 / DSM 19594 / LMG 11500 / NCIMB 11436 / LSU 4) TaxID=761193 RepID=A0A7U3ZRD3_RUNSL|nr:carbamoyltransferase HypF [Runella slithyformis]AEI51960.1 (NiFe) hydrogenase maturation protein HypF [Runella slithyformis DSM 19594]